MGYIGEEKKKNVEGTKEESPSVAKSVKLIEEVWELLYFRSGAGARNLSSLWKRQMERGFCLTWGPLRERIAIEKIHA